MKKITPNRITAIWKEYVQLLNLKQVERISIPETVRQHQAKCRDVVKSGSVRPWILCFDEALQFLRYLHDWTWELQSHYPDKMRAVTMLLTGRLCTLASAIRLLAISGFEE